MLIKLSTSDIEKFNINDKLLNIKVSFDDMPPDIKRWIDSLFQKIIYSLMKHLKMYEFFSFGRKKDKLPNRENWEENLKQIFNNYKG